MSGASFPGYSAPATAEVPAAAEHCRPPGGQPHSQRAPAPSFADRLRRVHAFPYNQVRRVVVEVAQRFPRLIIPHDFREALAYYADETGTVDVGWEGAAVAAPPFRSELSRSCHHWKGIVPQFGRRGHQ